MPTIKMNILKNNPMRLNDNYNNNFIINGFKD